jgi:hypothetical protein
MQDDKASFSKGRPKQPPKDIAPILQGWDYEPGTINVRKITGADGLPKLQMRLDLGVLQMEVDGRPDGARPHGCDSLLDYFEKQLRAHRKKNGSEEGFALTDDQCQALREEALMYYHRYLSLFVLDDFSGVARDTARNLRVLDMCGKYASDEQDRLILEQYRPYLIMMHARALASIDLNAGNLARSLVHVKRGLREIKAFFLRFGQEEAYRHCNEVRILKRFGREIQSKLPIDPIRKLQTELNSAVKDERYEDAARLRDEIERFKQSST